MTATSMLHAQPGPMAHVWHPCLLQSPPLHVCLPQGRGPATRGDDQCPTCLPLILSTPSSRTIPKWSLTQDLTTRHDLGRNRHSTPRRRRLHWRRAAARAHHHRHHPARAVTTSWSGQRRSFPRAIAHAVLRRDPICRHCLAARATVADHITPHAEGGTDTLDNGQGLCEPCHSAKTEEEKLRGQQRWRAQHRHPIEPHPGLTA